MIMDSVFHMLSVLEISAQLVDTAVSSYQVKGVVCPPVLRKKTFTTATKAKYHNPTATTATTSFHGTGTSLFQYPTSDNMDEI